MKEAQEKTVREKTERAKKKPVIDLADPNTQEGVMDALLEALQSGSAFGRDKLRTKKAAPTSSGGNQIKLPISAFMTTMLIIFIFFKQPHEHKDIKIEVKQASDPENYRGNHATRDVRCTSYSVERKLDRNAWTYQGLLKTISFDTVYEIMK